MPTCGNVGPVSSSAVDTQMWTHVRKRSFVFVVHRSYGLLLLKAFKQRKGGWCIYEIHFFQNQSISIVSVCL